MSLKKGLKGEQVAEKYLMSLGYEILARNYHSFYGEVDLVCKKKETIIFVEVKNYKKDSITTPYESVTFSKQKKIIITAKKYLMENKLEHVSIQFDLIVIENGNIVDHLEGAFMV